MLGPRERLITMTSRSPKVPGRAVARFSQWIEALGALAIAIWAVFSFIDGHAILGTLLAAAAIGIGWVTVREFRGRGLGRVPTGAEDDQRY